MDTTDDDLKLADTPSIAKAAAAVTGMSGLLVGLTGLQLKAAGLRSRLEWVELVPYALIALGVLQVVFAAMIFRSRGWAVLTGAGVNALTALLACGWLVYSLSFSVSLLALGGAPVSALAVLMVLVSIPAVRRTSAARRRLTEQGLGLGL